MNPLASCNPHPEIPIPRQTRYLNAIASQPAGQSTTVPCPADQQLNEIFARSGDSRPTSVNVSFRTMSSHWGAHIVDHEPMRCLRMTRQLGSMSLIHAPLFHPIPRLGSHTTITQVEKANILLIPGGNRCISLPATTLPISKLSDRLIVVSSLYPEIFLIGPAHRHGGLIAHTKSKHRSRSLAHSSYTLA